MRSGPTNVESFFALSTSPGKEDSSVTALLEPYRNELEQRARQSLGTSGRAIYEMVSNALAARNVRGDLLLDIGCGTGNLFSFVRDRFQRYVGIDAVRYEGYPEEAGFAPADLNAGALPLDNDCADAVVAVETIEHLENPRAFVRELTRLAKPGGWIIVTTPNQLSLLSKLTFLLKNQFNAFQEGSYPAHLTALLESDLRRIAGESGWEDVAIHYSFQGRLALTSHNYPQFLSRVFPRGCSDNILIFGGKKECKRRPSISMEGQ
jgi:2-polyprenyl-3-methyl-5-hydroxy-6-metoxy-1,4-benzoquinol methylase